MNNKPAFALFILCLAVFAAPSSHAALIQGPSFITPSTSIPPCEISICSGFGTDINEIADGDSSNFNGYAGADGLTGVITLDLLGNFDLQSFTLWNDLNVNNEGVDTFMLHFFDEFDNLIESTSTLTAPAGQFAPQTYIFDSTILDVSKVDLETLTLLTGGVGSRIEIREVAFNGDSSMPNPIPVPAAVWLFGTALIGFVGMSRRRKVA